MQSIYLAGTSVLHRLHPLTKLAGVLLVVVATYSLPWWFVSPLLCVFVLLVAALAGVLRRVAISAFFISILPLLSLVIIQGLLFPPTRTTVVLDLGWYTLWLDGLVFAARIWFRLLSVVLSVLLIATTTHPADLVNALTSRGLPRSIGYIVLVALQLVPDMIARATGILEAQRSRGLETDGFVRRLLVLFPLVSPLIIGALSDAEERAVALESRAFNTSGPKTSWRVLHDSTAQRVARAVCVLGAVAIVVARFTLLRGIA